MIQKGSLIFLFFFYRNEVQVEKILPFFENLRKTFSIGKKSDFKFQNRGMMMIQKGTLIFLFFYRNKVQVNFFLPIFENLQKMFSIGKKSDFKVKIRDFCDPKRFSDFFFFEINLSRKKKIKFSKICEKRFLSEKNPTSSFKIGGFCDQKSFSAFFL